LKLWKRFKRSYEKRALDCVEENIIGRQNRINFSITLLPVIKGLFLDIGSADGLLLEMVGADIAVGTDISIEYCRKMKEKKIEAINCVAECLSLADETFDTITCTEVLEHVLYSNKVVHEIHRVLKNGGHVLFSVPYREKLAAYSRCKYEFAHLRTFDENFVETLFDTFTIKSVKYYAFRFIFIRFHNAFINKILNAMWKIQSLRSFFVNYHKHMKFLDITRNIKPTYMLILAVKKL
jgi:SAM-dependent methyltransferase